jgi:phenylpropionate dioxygenase-like ring-hydroxylating dioxygenase large terminal subunit
LTLDAYRPYWHPLTVVSEIGAEPRRYDLLGESLVAFRTEAGISVFRDLCVSGSLCFGISVFRDLCVHRGTALSLGRVVDDSLECAYHGWRYDASGKCIRIPSLEPGASIPPKA